MTKIGKTTPRNGRCFCGLKTSLHFDSNNVKLSCDVAKTQHPRATVVPTPFTSLLTKIVERAK